MPSFVQKLWQDESGQDLIEYTLLVAFIALAATSLFISTGSGIEGIWGTANKTLSSAAAGTSAPSSVGRDFS